MSEYWKSTPKYWCKFCKTYVRDTKLEKQQHDATPRHQGNIQRSLRTLHREREREDRDKQRAKDEVARLNGIVSGGAIPSGSKPASAHLVQPGTVAPKQASAEERKRQMKQLVELGVEVPKEYRSDFAMSGQWESTGQQRSIAGLSFKEDEDVKPGELSFGVRKRKYEGAEEEEEAGDTVVRKGWGSTTRRYPGQDQEGEDIEALFKGESSESTKTQPVESITEVKKEASVGGGEAADEVLAGVVKSEEAGEALPSPATAAIVFKKRKARVAKVS